MPIPNLQIADYAGQLVSLLPRGRAWPKGPDSFLVQVMGWLAPTFARSHLRAAYLITDGFPSSAVELLPQWELSLGLPDPCAGLSPTLQSRRAQVLARFAGLGGQSVSYFINFAANLGYPVTISEFTALRFGASFGTPMYSDAWATAWQINAPTFTVQRFRFGQSFFGEPFSTWGNTVLQCEIQSFSPAYTLPIFAYS